MTKEQIEKVEKNRQRENKRKSADILARNGFRGSEIIRRYRFVLPQIRR